MGKFTLYNYNQLSDKQKVGFNKTLALGLSFVMDDIKSDGDLNISLIDEFIASSGKCSGSTTIVEDLYSKISSRIQARNGNQPLSLSILAKYKESWEATIRK